MTQPLSHSSAITSSRRDTNLENSSDSLTTYDIHADNRSILSAMFNGWDVLSEVQKSTRQPEKWSVHFWLLRVSPWFVFDGDDNYAPPT
jgi:hypothetical protein